MCPPTLGGQRKRIRLTLHLKASTFYKPRKRREFSHRWSVPSRLDRLALLAAPPSQVVADGECHHKNCGGAPVSTGPRKV